MKLNLLLWDIEPQQLPIWLLQSRALARRWSLPTDSAIPCRSRSLWSLSLRSALLCVWRCTHKAASIGAAPGSRHMLAGGRLVKGWSSFRTGGWKTPERTMCSLCRLVWNFQSLHPLIRSGYASVDCIPTRNLQLFFCNSLRNHWPRALLSSLQFEWVLTHFIASSVVHFHSKCFSCLIEFTFLK